MKIADVSIRRPVFAVMLIGGLVALGLVSLPRLGVDLFPRVEFPMVTVVTVLEGASPETVERSVTQPLEEAINSIEGVRKLRSASSDSLSQIFVEFSLDQDVHRKAQDVRDKVSEARGNLPVDAEAPIISRVDPDSTPILTVLVAGPQSIRSLSELADKRLKPRLERVPGVGSVTLVGGRTREVRIWIDPVKLTGYALAVDDVLGALRREHIELPGGRVETEHEEFVVKTRGKLTSPAQFGALVVSEREGRLVRLADVATVEDGMAEERTVARLNGDRGVSLQIRRQSGENTVAVSNAIKAELGRIRETLPPGVELVETQDLARFIQSSVDDVFVDMAWGGLLAVLVVLAFLRSGRSTLIAATAIPSSLLASFSFFYFFGFTLNVLTLMALSLSIGLLVDDAIVVIENIYRHIELGEDPREAASSATREIGLAVVATTLSICAVFVPIAFMGGMMGRFFREFGLVVTVAVLVSMLVALTLTPMLSSRYLRVSESHGRVYHAFESAYAGLERRYRRLLAWGLSHRLAIVGIAAAAIVAGGLVARGVPLDLIIEADRSEFSVWMKLPLGSTLAQTQASVAAVEEALRAQPDVRSVFSTIGGGLQKRVNEASLFVQLTHKTDRRRTQARVMEDTRRVIAGLGLPLRDYAVEQIPWFSAMGGRFTPLMYSIRGPDIGRLNELTQALMAKLRGAGGYPDLTSSYETGKPEIALEINRERAADLGVPALQIGTTIATLIGGPKIASLEEGGERYDVRVQVLPEYRNDPLKLGLLMVRAPTGALVPLPNLVSAQIASGPVQIDRENRARVITMLGNIEGKALGDATKEVERFSKDLGIAGEYEIHAAGQTEHMAENVASISFAFMMAIAALYMILASQFNSFVHPFTMMLAAPLSFVGAFAALWIAGLHLDMMGQIGLLMLMGLVMKNGILLVDYTNTLRERGLARNDAVLEAGPTRLRPVLMTTVAMIFGMLPVAFGRGDGSEWRSPIGILAIGGLLTSTFLTLLIVPVIYTLVDDAQEAVVRAASALRARLTGRAPARREEQVRVPPGTGPAPL